MAQLLHIDSSPMTDSSVSRALAAAFRQIWDAAPAGPVVHRDVAADPLPHLDRDAITTFYMPEQFRNPAQRVAAASRTALAEELLAADAVLMSAPMFNWTVPSHLKAWIDQVLIQGLTLVGAGERPPMVDRPATIVLAYGGGYTPTAPLAGWDHVEPYLRTLFADALGMDTEIITAQLTLLGDTTLGDQTRASRIAAESRVRERAVAVVERLAVGAASAL